MNEQKHISPGDWELIEQYLQQELSPEAAAAFEARLQTDAVLAGQVQEVRTLLLGVQEAALKEQLQEYHKGWNATQPVIKQQAGIRQLWRWSAAAAVLLLAMGIWWWTGRSSATEKLYQAYYKPDPGLLTAMGPATAYAFEHGMVAYKNEQYQQAIDQWQPLLQTTPSSDTVRYFLGMAWQAMHKYDSAAALLQPLAENTNRAFHKEASWYYGLLLIRSGKGKDAIRYIDGSSQPGKEELIHQLNK
ncbi:MAG: hypothetical protein QM781_06495 [Chitinophagaceae bacterium]